jgi:hypothetical protein
MDTGSWQGIVRAPHWYCLSEHRSKQLRLLAINAREIFAGRKWTEDSILKFLNFLLR